MIRLRELREARDLSVKDMCRKLGVDDSRYRKWDPWRTVYAIYLRKCRRC